MLTQEPRFDAPEEQALYERIKADCVASGKFRDAAGRTDSARVIFTANELTQYIKKIYEWMLAPLDMRSILPSDTGTVPEHAETFVYRMYEPIGAAVLAASYGDAIPRADVIAHEFPGKMRPILTSYGWDYGELLAAAANSIPLTLEKGKAARRAYEEKYDATGRAGNAAHGLLGFFNHPNVPIVSATTKAAGGLTWAVATPDEIVADVAAGVASIVTQTKNAFREANLIVVPASPQGTSWRQRRMGDGTNVSIRSYVEQANPRAKVIESYWLTGAGAGSVDRMIVAAVQPGETATIYENPFTQEPPERKGLRWEVACHGRTSGAVIIQPLAMAYVDGI